MVIFFVLHRWMLIGHYLQRRIVIGQHLRRRLILAFGGLSFVDFFMHSCAINRQSLPTVLRETHVYSWVFKDQSCMRLLVLICQPIHTRWVSRNLYNAKVPVLYNVHKKYTSLFGMFGCNMFHRWVQLNQLKLCRR